VLQVFTAFSAAVPVQNSSLHALTHFTYSVFVSGNEVIVEVTRAYTIKADYCIHSTPPTLQYSYPIAGLDKPLRLVETMASRIS